MDRTPPIWPTLDALDALWASPAGQGMEQAKAAAMAELVLSQVPARPRTLLIGAASRPLLEGVESLKPSSLFIAYPPPLGARVSATASLMMDTDLPPFARASFDLVLLSHVLEYRSTPLALLSLAYEILQSHGRLLIFTPHALAPRGSRLGLGASHWDMGVRSLLRRAAFTPLGARTLRHRGWRPTDLVHLAQPQVPPRPTGLRPRLPMLAEFWRQRRPEGIAASTPSGLGQGDD